MTSQNSLSMGINWDELRDCTPDFDGILLERFEEGNEDCDDCWVTLIGLEKRPPADEDCCPPLAPADAALDCGKSFGFFAGGIPTDWLWARTTLGFGGGAAGVDLSSPSDETTNFWGPLGFEPAQKYNTVVTLKYIIPPNANRFAGGAWPSIM